MNPIACLRVHSGERGCSAFPFPFPLSKTSASSLGGLLGGSLLCGECSDGGDDSLGGVDGDDDDDEIYARFITQGSGIIKIIGNN